MFEKLAAVQLKLKAPKSQRNTYGNYSYRSCEDILEAVKPVLNENKATIIVTDSVEMVGDRFYVAATAKFIDLETGDSVEAKAYAREPQAQKGMSDSQLTGTASSYARKYALNGLLLIDDTKDADTDENHMQTSGKKQEPQQEAGYPDSKTMLEAIYRKYPRGTSNYNAMIAAIGVDDIEHATDIQLMAVYNKATKK